MPRLGAHLSIAGGLPRAVDRAEASGCEALQIFTKSAGQWRAREIPDEEIALFRRRIRETKIGPVVAHNSYLINLAAADPEHVSVASGVNNAVARTASLGAIALVPVVSRLSSATGAGEVTHAFRVGLVLIAALAASAALTARFGLRRTTTCEHGPRRVHCHLDGPPLQVRISA